MFKRMPILPLTELETIDAVRYWVTQALAEAYVTRNQWQALTEFLAPRVPVHATLACRTPKGVIYVLLRNPDGTLSTYRLSPRADWYHPGQSDEEFRRAAQLNPSQ